MPIQICITIPDDLIPEAKQFVATLPESIAGTPALDPATATTPQIKARAQSILMVSFKAMWQNWKRSRPDSTLDTIITG